MRSASQMHWAFLDTPRHFKHIYLTYKIKIKGYVELRNEAPDKTDVLLPGDRQTTMTIWTARD